MIQKSTHIILYLYNNQIDNHGYISTMYEQYICTQDFIVFVYILILYHDYRTYFLILVTLIERRGK